MHRSKVMQEEINKKDENSTQNKKKNVEFFTQNIRERQVECEELLHN